MRIISHKMDGHTEERLLVRKQEKTDQFQSIHGNVEKKAAEIQNYLTSKLMEEIGKDH